MCSKSIVVTTLGTTIISDSDLVPTAALVIAAVPSPAVVTVSPVIAVLLVTTPAAPATLAVKVTAAVIGGLLVPTLVSYTTQLYATLVAKGKLLAAWVRENAAIIANTAVLLANKIGIFAMTAAKMLYNPASLLATISTWNFSIALNSTGIPIIVLYKILM